MAAMTMIPSASSSPRVFGFAKNKVERSDFTRE